MGKKKKEELLRRKRRIPFGAGRLAGNISTPESIDHNRNPEN